MATSEIIMPKMGDAMDEGKIVQWLKNIGDAIKSGDAVAEIETDKSNVEIEAETSGFLTSITAQPGDTVPVGSVIAMIGAEAPANGASPAPAIPSAPKMEAAPVAPPSPAASSNGQSAPKDAVPAPAEPSPVVREAAPAAVVTPVYAPVKPAPVAAWSSPVAFQVGALPEGLGGASSLVGEPVAPDNSSENGRIRATPLARAMAQQHNLDLSTLNSAGVVRADDVQAALSAPATQSAPAQQAAAPVATPRAEGTIAKADEGDTVQEFSGMRKVIAKRLVESKTTIPHFYVSTEIDMEEVISLREKINTGAGEGQPKVSINDCLLKAVAAALSEHPKVNAVYGDNSRILRKKINVGFGVALEDGLIVPVVKDCGSKSLRAIARETKPLIEKARAGKLSPADYTGGTFTISNLGVYADITEFGAIINPGEGAILAVASTVPTPVVKDGAVVVRRRMKVTLSGDHRVMDGADGAVFLLTLKRIVENPLEMLA